MHPLSAAQRDAAMIIFQSAGTARLGDLTLFLGTLTDLGEQWSGAIQKPYKSNADGKA
jgi:hypothetical protein